MEKSSSQPLWTKRFIILCVLNLLFFMSFFMLLPTLPPYLVHELGAGEDQAGLIMGIFTIAAVLCRPVTGYWMDRFNQKTILLISIGIFVISSVGYIYLQSILLIFFLRFVYGLGFGMSTTASSTMAAEWVPAKRRGEGLGYFGTFMMAAMSIGPLVGVFVAEQWNYIIMFIVCAALSVLAILLSFFLKQPKSVDRKKDTVAKKFSLKSKEDMKYWVQELIEVKTIPVALSMMMISITFGGIVTFVSLYAEELADTSAAGWYFTIYAMALILTRPFAGRWYDRNGPNFVIPLGTLLYFIGVLNLGFASNQWMLYSAAIIIGIGYGTLQPSYQALAIESAPDNRRGAATATFFTFFDIGVGIGSMLLGWVVTVIGYGNMYLLSSVFLLVSYFIFYLNNRRKNQKVALLKDNHRDASIQ